MATFRIGPYSFVNWRGQPPQLTGEQISSHTKPGTDGVGQQKLGRVGVPFEAELESWFGGSAAGRNFALAKAALRDYQLLRGAGLLVVVYNSINYADTFRHAYTVEDVTELMTRTAVRLVGANVDYAGGARLITRFRMTPHYLEPS